MPFRRDHAMAPLTDRQRHQLRILVERLGRDTDINLAIDHPFGNLRRAALVHLELDARMLGDEIADHDRQRIARLGVRRAEDQAAAVAA